MAEGIVGLDKIQKKLARLNDSIKTGRFTDEAVRAGAEYIRGIVEERTPVSTEDYGARGKKVKRTPGNAKRHVIVHKRVKLRKLGEISYLVGWAREAFYMFFRERGTSHQPARPILRPVFDAHAGEAINRAYEVMRRKFREEMR